jgi:hypothetical protein
MSSSQQQPGLTQHTEELKTFISIHNIDIMLISEMHSTYAVYHMNHPDRTAADGDATIATFPNS